MALVNYIEPISIGEIFIGLGSLILCFVLAYIFYRLYIKLAQFGDVVINREAKYEILEETFLDKIGNSKGIDLNEELIKRQMFKTKKSFRKRVEDKIYEDMFGKETKK